MANRISAPARRLWYGVLLSLTVVCQSAPAASRAPVHHDIVVELDPERHSLTVEDQVSLAAPPGRDIRFSLHAGLDPQVQGAQLQQRPGDEARHAVPVTHYRVRLNDAQTSFVIRYSGEIHHPLQQMPGEERQFQVSPGLIAQQGVFLDSDSHWFPVMADTALVTFSLEVRLPGGWDAVSQGGRRHHRRAADATTVRWVASQPQDDIYLVAARFEEYRRQSGDVSLQAFLRSPEEALARRYLDKADDTIAMYQRLLGPYPYEKFALVENFWQTGYGMPSFTLMGSRIIRFPFIIHTSYPHEILHNWWGNGVYVDYRRGNWSEGLTAYLADHLLREQRGRGTDYRRELLQKYTDFVSGAKDFPLTRFRGRHSQASEAVGYGKTLMLFHMLRRELGDALFIRGLRRFYRDNLFAHASFDDLRQAFEQAGDVGLDEFFRQWVERTGAPRLEVMDAVAAEQDGSPRLELTLRQRQAGPAYRLRVPLAVTMDGETAAYQTTVHMTKKQQRFSLAPPAPARRLDVDPEFDVFRRLAAAEIPPALSSLFGARSVLIVLPGEAPQDLLAAYRRLARTWQGAGSTPMEITLDEDLETLPAGRAVWLFGWENRFRQRMTGALAAYKRVSISDNGLQLGKHAFPAVARSMVLTAPAGDDGHQVLGWLMTTSAGAVTGLGRKLPHYTKYSYLVFEGQEPQNIDRGKWPVLNSPMAVMLTDGRNDAPVPRAGLAARRPLTAVLHEKTDGGAKPQSLDDGQDGGH